MNSLRSSLSAHYSGGSPDLENSEFVWKKAAEAPFPDFRAAALIQLGNIELHRGDDEAARALFQQAMETAGSGSGGELCAAALQHLAVLSARRGDPQRAKELLRQAITAMEKATTQAQLADALQLLSSFQSDCHEHSEAQCSANESLRIRREVFGNDSNHVIASLVNCGVLYARSFNWTEAACCLRGALEISERIGTAPQKLSSVVTSLAVALGMNGEHGAMLELLKRYLASMKDEPERSSAAAMQISAVVAACESPRSRLLRWILRLCRFIGIEFGIPAVALPWLRGILAPKIIVHQNDFLPFVREEDPFEPLLPCVSISSASSRQSIASEIDVLANRDSAAGTMRLHRSMTSAPPRARVGRNEPCPCRSGRKFKKCCGKPSSDRRD